jgi:hypothetical protein
MQTPNLGSVELSGTVIAFNVSLRGNVEGLLVQTPGGVAQVNIPEDRVDTLLKVLKLGGPATLLGRFVTQARTHPVYAFVDGDHGAGGVVVRMNYGLDGEINGVHLDGGTYVHLGPGDAEKYHLKVGEAIIATGSRCEGTAELVIDAHRVERVANVAFTAPEDEKRREPSPADQR